MGIFTGVDPSLDSTGIVSIYQPPRASDAPEEFFVDRVRSKSDPEDTIRDLANRIGQVCEEVLRVVPPGAELVAVEGPAFNALRQTGAHRNAGVWWRVVGKLSIMRGLRIAVVEPTVLKKYATGNGRASKDEVYAAAIRRYPAADVNNRDEADALVLAAIAARLYGDPVEKSLPAANIAALDKVKIT